MEKNNKRKEPKKGKEDHNPNKVSFSKNLIILLQ